MADERRGGSIRELIDEERDQLKKELYRSDDEFDPERDLPHGPAFFGHAARSRDEVVIDELLASAPRNQGYYLKLHKENPILPGTWEFKMKIDNYDAWSDLEYEISNLVKGHTRQFGAKKWGSGRYRVSVWREGGIRDQKKYPVNDFLIDADEPEQEMSGRKSVDGVVDANEFVNQQFQTMKNFMDAMRGVLPAPADPNQHITALVNAFERGRGEKDNASNQMAQMLMAMMTGMFQMIPALIQGKNGDAPKESPSEMMMKFLTMMREGKDLMGFGGNNGSSRLVDQLAEMKAIGIDPFKKEDPLDQMAKVKMLMQSAQELSGNNQAPVERPGMLEKLVESLAPYVPKMLSDFRAATDNAAKVQFMQLEARKRAIAEGRVVTPPENRPRTSYGAPVGPQPDRMGAGDAFSEPPDMDPYSGYTHRPSRSPQQEMEGHPDIDMMTPGDGSMRTARPGGPPRQNPTSAESETVTPLQEKDFEGMHPMLSQLYYLAGNDDRNAYPALYETISKFPGAGEMIQAVLEGQATTDEVIQLLQRWGGKPFRYPPFVQKFRGYFEGFVEWVRGNVEASQIRGVCDRCGQVYWYDSMDKYYAEPDHSCDNAIGPSENCPGTVKLESADNGSAQAPTQ